MNTAKDRRVNPAQLKQIGPHTSYATLAASLRRATCSKTTRSTGCCSPPALPGPGCQIR
jgi:hypothetical protein